MRRKLNVTENDHCLHENHFRPYIHADFESLIKNWMDVKIILNNHR